jgi:hypothetical protein
MITSIKSLVSNYFWVSTIKKHYSRMGRNLAPKYTDYLKTVQASYYDDSVCKFAAQSSVSNFLNKGFCSYWDVDNRVLADSILTKIKDEEHKFGEGAVWDAGLRYTGGDIFQKFPQIEVLFKGQVGLIIQRIYGANYKIFYGVMYKSVRKPGDVPAGSQLWHSDGGPGTCLNVMFCLNATDSQNGAMEFVPWNVSVNLFSSERKDTRKLLKNNRLKDHNRSILCDYYTSRINSEFSHERTQLLGDPGLVLLFRNNVVHRGGYPAHNQVRYVCVFHVYPSASVTPWTKYRHRGIQKLSPYPKDPDF